MIVLDYKSSKPIYEQITEQIKLNVMKGYLKPGDAIPSVRKLALELKITPGTVSKAYQETFIVDEIELKPDEGKLQTVRKNLRTELMELKLMGYNREMIVELIKGIYEEMNVC